LLASENEVRRSKLAQYRRFRPAAPIDYYRKPMLDVIVVGGGPAGLSCASLLAEEGFDVAVLEEHETIGAPTHCTGLVSDEVSELFKVSEAMVLARPMRCAIVGPSGRGIIVSGNGEGIAVIDRAVFDQDVAAAARRAGAEVRVGVRAQSLAVDRHRVVVTAGDGQRVTARACVLACGVGYGLGRQVGLGMPALSLHSAQLEVPAAGDGGDVELHVGVGAAPQGFAWLVPVGREAGPRVKIGLVARGDAGAHLARFLARRDIAARLAEPAGPPLRRLLPLGPLPATYARRVLAVGDAAGLTKPTTGGGIFYGLLSGSLAAETLTDTLRRDRLEANDLVAYERRWRARLGPHLAVSAYVRRLLVTLDDRTLDALLDAVGSDDVQEVIRRTARFNWHGEVIRSVLAQRGIKRVLLRALFR
jgi:geranylgeranyl reductase family protein